MKNLFNFLGLLALIVFPSTVLGFESPSGATYAVVILSGLLSLFIYRKEHFPVSPDEKKLFFSVALFYFMALAGTLYLGTSIDNADRFMAMVLIIPGYMFFKSFPYNKEKYLWSGLVLGAFASVGVGLYQVFGPEHLARAKGVTHPILYGDIALIMGLMSLAGIGWFKSQKNWMVILPVIAFIAGLLSSALSLSRGGWVALPLIGLLYFWFLTRFLTFKKVAVIAVLFVGSLSVIYLLPQTGVQKRVDNTLQNLNHYLDSQSINDQIRSSSIGTRFEMWKAAWILFKENPVVGVGWDQYIDKARQLADKGLVSKSAYAHSHPHNEFLSTLAKGGLLSFIGLMSLLLYPAYYFYRAIKNHTEPEIQRAALAGLILITGFACFGFSEAIFERSRPANFYSFYLAVLLAMVTNYSAGKTGKVAS